MPHNTPFTRARSSPKNHAMDTGPAISIKNLVKRYAPFKGAPGKLALDDVSFDVPQGQIFGLLGPNRSEERRGGKECA